MVTPNFQQFIKQENASPGQQFPQQDQLQEFPQQGQEQMPVTADNPFDVARYRDVQLPDEPIRYNGGMVESLLNDDEVPAEVKKNNWFIFHKDNTLTFLDEQRKLSKLMNFDIIKIDTLNAMPYYDYTWEKELEFSVLRNVFETKLDRALGFKGGNIKNERIVLQSQFQENRQISEDGSGQNMIREGFFKRLLGRR